MVRLTDTQSLILSRAATRPGLMALPLPAGLAGAAATMAVRTMIGRGWLEEVEANTHRKEPLWRETGDGAGTTLIATEVGMEAIGIEPVAAEAVAGARRGSAARQAEAAKMNTAIVEPDDTASSIDTGGASLTAPVRAGTKQSQIIALLQRPEGAAIREIAAETGWQAHTIRGAISGALKKKLGLPVTAEKLPGRGTVYRIAAGHSDRASSA